jgi:hypothetical protein
MRGRGRLLVLRAPCSLSRHGSPFTERRLFGTHPWLGRDLVFDSMFLTIRVVDVDTVPVITLPFTIEERAGM